MDSLILVLGWAGIFAPLALGAVGSMIGCMIAGQAACGALLEVESGYGRYIGLSALPSSQTIYGIVLMFGLRGDRIVTLENAPALAAIGILAGIGLLSIRYPRPGGILILAAAAFLFWKIFSRDFDWGSIGTAVIVCTPLIVASFCLFLRDASDNESIQDLDREESL